MFWSQALVFVFSSATEIEIVQMIKKCCFNGCGHTCMKPSKQLSYVLREASFMTMSGDVIYTHARTHAHTETLYLAWSLFRFFVCVIQSILVLNVRLFGHSFIHSKVRKTTKINLTYSFAVKPPPQKRARPPLRQCPPPGTGPCVYRDKCGSACPSGKICWPTPCGGTECKEPSKRMIH